jgi:hypothetical protein
MRQLPTSTPLARTAFAALATAALVAAQSPDPRGATTAPQRLDPLFHGLRLDLPALEPARVDADGRTRTGGRLDPDSGETLPSWRAPEVDATRWPGERALPVVQDDDGYAVTRLFNDMHGDFMQKGFPFQQNIRVGAGYQAEAGMSGSEGKYQFSDARADVFVPMTLDPDMLLIVGGRGGGRAYEFDSAAGGATNESVFEASLHVGLGRFLTEDLYVEAMFRPGVYSDFDGTLHGDDWKFFGDVIATYRFDPGFYGKIGAIYDGTFEDAPIFPALGFALLLDETFRIDMLLPKYFELAWMPNATWILKGGLGLDGEEYHVRSSTGPGTEQRFDVRTQEFRIYVDGTMRLNDNFSVFGRGGATLLGDYKWAGFDGSVDPAPFFEIGAGLNF